jgi:hypothetical protein
VGVPLRFAKALSFKQAVTPWNYAALALRVRNGADVWPGATHVENEVGEVIDLRLCPPAKRDALARALLVPSAAVAGGGGGGLSLDSGGGGGGGGVGGVGGGGVGVGGAPLTMPLDVDGRDVLVYHARDYRDIVGDPLNNPDRHTRAAVLSWRPDGTPVFDFGP